jgi:thiol-disulfide isomerase/thioredoxin
MTRATAAFFVGCLAGLVGCGGPPPASTVEKSPAPAGEEKSATVPPKSAGASTDEAGQITVGLIDADGLQAAIARHKGKVVLVDCWATWCVPCIQGFPKTVALGRDHADEGLVVISLSFDDPSDEGKVREFLRKQQATFENYISKLDLEREGAEAFAIDGGSLPHYKLYGRTGELLRTFSNSDPDESFSHEMLADSVREALAADK